MSEEKINEAKKLLSEEGYAIIKVTDAMEERMDKCANGEDEDCCGCCCSICILNNL